MALASSAYMLSFAAGVLSTLSPCVLPLLPIVFATAAVAHRLGPYVLSMGLALSFTLLGVFVASLGVSLGVDSKSLQSIAAAMFIVFGAILLSPQLQSHFAAATSGICGAGQSLIARVSPAGLPGQFVLGLVLGIVWSPCVGPTLGAAITLANQRRDLANVALQMALFGIGAALPLIVIGSVSRQAITRSRGRLLMAGKIGKQMLGATLLVLGILILSGTDKMLETWVLQSSPDWLVKLTTSL